MSSWRVHDSSSRSAFVRVAQNSPTIRLTRSNSAIGSLPSIRWLK